MVGNTLTSWAASFLSAVRVFQGVTWVLSRRAKPLLPIKSFRIFPFGVHLLLTHICPSCEYSCDNIYIPKDGGLITSAKPGTATLQWSCSLVPIEGFEPPNELVGREGLEPPTLALRVPSSAN